MAETSIIKAALELIKVLDTIPARVVERSEVGSCHGADVSPEDHARIVMARNALREALKAEYEIFQGYV